MAAYTLVVRNARGRVVASVPLGRDPVTIGRGGDCTVVLPSTAVSRKHASVHARDDGKVVIQDEGSANGVKIDGAFVKKPTVVSERHQIEISEFTLRLEPVSATDQVRAAIRRNKVPERASERASVRAPERERARELDPEPEPEEQVSFDTMLEPHAGAALALAHSSLQLVGRGGPYDGTVFKLEKPLLTVGRSGADLTLDDPSISRRHAQIRLSAAADSITVLDLRSSNGTYVDGERVKRAECRPGQVVRFGDLPFRLTREQREVKSEKRLSPGKRIALALAVLLVLGGGVGVVAYLKRPKPLPPVTITPEQRLREIQAEAQRFVDDGRRRIDLKEWNATPAALEKAKEKDPLNGDIPRLRQQALDELENERLWKKGQEFLSLGSKADSLKAKEVFEKVPATSVYHREVRYKIKAIDQRIAEDFRVEGVTRCEKRYWEDCHRALCKFFELMPAEVQVPGEPRLVEMLENVEKRLARKKGFATCQAKRFLERGGRVSAGKGDDPATKLEEKYEVAELRDVLMIYLGGKIDPALKKLNQTIALASMRPHLTQLREVNRQLLIIKGKYQEGYSSYRERKVSEAQREWDLVLQADSALLPEGIESFYRREVTRMLGDLYYELGDEQFKAGRYRPAYDLWSKGKLANPKHERLLNGMLQLEKAAERLVREGQSLSSSGNISDARTKLELARDITDKGRPTHSEAEKALGELQ